MTAREYLQELPEPYRILAAQYICLYDEYDSLAQTIDWGMTWSETREGLEFWSEVHEYCCGFGDLPPIPNYQPKPKNLKGFGPIHTGFLKWSQYEKSN